MADLDWALRKGKITASTIASLVPGAYPADARWARDKDALDAFVRCTGRQIERGDPSRKNAGHRVERFLLDWHHELTGTEWAHFGSMLHPRAPWFLATPDAAFRCPDGAAGVGEAKAVGLYMADQWDEHRRDADGVPPYVMIQCEAQAEVCDADRCIVLAYFGGTDFRIYSWERDVDLGAALLEIATRFYVDHLKPDSPPAPGLGTSLATIAALFPSAKRPLERATPEVDDAVSRYIAAGNAEKAAAELKSDVRAELAMLVGDREGFTGEGWTVKFSDRAGYRVAYEVAGSRVLSVNEKRAKKKGRAA